MRGTPPRSAVTSRCGTASWTPTAATATAEATPDSAACAAAWADDARDRAATLTALYAIESAQPAISETKRLGLVEHYGAAPDTDATRYFDLHAVLDVQHAAHAREELAAILRPGDEDRLVAEAERAPRADRWGVLPVTEDREPPRHEGCGYPHVTDDCA
jgi:Iron-containing redox enzyme